MSCCVWVRESLQNLCQNYDETEKRNFLASVGAGTLFAIGWWILIDAAAMYPNKEELHHAYHICGVVGTIAMLMINSLSNAHLRGDAYTEGCLGPFGARIWLFLGLVMSFGALIGACYILFGGYVIVKAPVQYPGVAIFLQNIFIFLSSIIYKFGRLEDN